MVGSLGHLAGCITRHDMMVFFEHEILKDTGLGLKFVPKGRPDESDFIEVPEGHTVDSVEVTKFLAGQTLRQLDLRATGVLNVIGIRRKPPEGIERIAPDPGRSLVLGEVLLVVGDERAVRSFEKAIE